MRIKMHLHKSGTCTCCLKEWLNAMTTLDKYLTTLSKEIIAFKQSIRTDYAQALNKL